MSRARIFRNRFLGLVLPLVAALTLGLLAPPLWHGLLTGPSAAGYLRLAGGAAVLTLISAAVAFTLGTVIDDRVRALGMALALWLGGTVLWDGLLLFLAVAFGDRPIEGTLVATTSSGSSFTMKPEARTFPGLMGSAPTETNEAALLTRPGGQLYAVLGQPVASDDGGADRYQIRLWWKPLVWWIWLGGALIAIGAALSLLGRAQLLTIWRAWRARKAEERFA